MSIYNELIERNKKWVADTLNKDANFFTESAKGQSPEILWIGCADSRVPAEEVTGTGPGEVFVHRNVANLVVHNDVNLLAVLQYAVEHLKVKHIVVCGHYGCGGVAASMSNADFGVINKWIRNIKDVYNANKDELKGISDSDKRTDRLVELNVAQQVKNLGETSIVQKAWADGNPIQVHGWVYALKDGLLTNLNVSLKSKNDVDEIYRYDF